MPTPIPNGSRLREPAVHLGRPVSCLVDQTTRTYDRCMCRRASQWATCRLLACPESSERLERMKYYHEFRDPVHDFIKVTSHEREIINSRPVQRLRHINQLALTNMIYHGTTHRRFEHSLGVMHLAGVAFDELTDPQNTSDEVRELIPELNQRDNFSYWRTVVRMAALCHDLGHLPFSHAAEHLLPIGYTHERISADIICSEELSALLMQMTPPINPEVVAKLAVGPKESRGTSFSVWEGLLSEIVTGNAFGVDRMDYLLRDSLHAGVEYGKFDHRRLIQSLRFLSPPPQGLEEVEALAPAIGIDSGGINSAEALLHARYHMFSQRYFHPVRVAYDIHLVDFLGSWLPSGKFSVEVGTHLGMTDNEVWVGIREASQDGTNPAHEAALRILNRDHYKVLYSGTSLHERIIDEPGAVVASWAEEQFGADNVRRRSGKKLGGTVDFPVRLPNGFTDSSLNVSETISRLPANSYDYVYIDPRLRDMARKRLTPELITAMLKSAAEDQTKADDEEAAKAMLNTTVGNPGE